MLSESKIRVQRIHSANNSKLIAAALLAFYIGGFAAGQSFLKSSRFLLLFAGANSEAVTGTNWISTFSVLFLSQSIFLLLSVAAGLSAIGIVLLPVLFTVKGLGFGVLAAALWQAAGKAGLLRLWLFHWFPEAVLLWMMFCLAKAAWPLSEKLGQICFMAKGVAAAPTLRRRLLWRYLVLQICEIAVCFLNIRLQLILSGIIFR